MKIITPKQKLVSIIQTKILPIMKKAGFKQKGNWFIKNNEENSFFINILSSRFNTKENIDFTIEIYVMKKDEKPLRNQPLAFERIGQLKQGKEYWYNITPEINSEEIGNVIQEDILKYIFPFLEKY